MTALNRAEQIARLKSGETFDLLIVGGGATGLGAAVDAAHRGYRVVLVEKYDFGKGTSSRSTKLVHGGVRYLKQGNLALVRSALIERGKLLRNAPHLVKNLKFVIPAYSRAERVFYGIGLKGYDVLAGALSFGRSLFLTREETLRHLPTLVPAGVMGGVLYHDGQFDDARLAINLMQTATERGAAVANYCECVRLLSDASGRLTGVVIHNTIQNETFEVRAKVVINATGVFVDELRRQEDKTAQALVAASQGIHLVLPKRFLPGSSALMIPKTSDGRVLFAVPWHDCVVAGTTDTPVAAASTEPRALPEEYDFVMSHAAKYLAEPPRDSDVLSVFAGLRPLVRSGQAQSTATLSRDHTIVVSKGGLVTITGGKWTTYRKMAEEVVNHAEKVAGLDHRPSRTGNLSIHGSSGSPVSGRLAIYGSDAASLQKLEDESGERAPVHPELTCSVAEVRWHARHEMAMTVEDVLARRTRSLLLNARAATEAAPAVATILAEELGRDAAWVKQQVDEFSQLAKQYSPALALTIPV